MFNLFKANSNDITSLNYNNLSDIAIEMHDYGINHKDKRIKKIIYGSDNTHRAIIIQKSNNSFNIIHEQLFLTGGKKNALRHKGKPGVWREYKKGEGKKSFNSLEGAIARVERSGFFQKGPEGTYYCPLMNDWIEKDLCNDMKMVNDGYEKSYFDNKSDFDNEYIDSVCTNCNRK